MSRSVRHLPGQPRHRPVPPRHYGSALPGEMAEWEPAPTPEPPRCGALPGPGQEPPDGGMVAAAGCKRGPGHGGRHVADAMTADHRVVLDGWTWPA